MIGEPGNSHSEPGGDEEDWFHGDEETKEPGDRKKQASHSEPGGKRPHPKQINVRTEKFTCMCINKNEGKYMIRLVPDEDAVDGVMELFLSAETQRYPAPLKKVTQIGGAAFVDGNKIEGLTFEKGKDLRFSVEIDYTDYCSMEVELYAASK